MFWVLKRTVSLRWFFWVPKTYVWKKKFFWYTLLTKGLDSDKLIHGKPADLDPYWFQQEDIEFWFFYMYILLG